MDLDEEMSFDNESDDNCDNDDESLDEGIAELSDDSDIDMKEKSTFEVLTADQIVQLMLSYVKDVSTIIEIPPTLTRILLNHFNWNKEKLIEKYYEEEQDTIFSEARIVNPNAYKSNVKAETSCNESFECGICFESCTSATGLQCGHFFCVECWNEYLKSKIISEGESQLIACAGHKCCILVDADFVMKLVQDPEVKVKYQHLITNSFVSFNPLLRWCPAAGCNNAIKVESLITAGSVTCKCSAKFCFCCGNECHEPLQCHLFKKWKSKCSEDGGTMTWITSNTQDCPSCHTPIEKSKGCNHIHCIKCNTHFCWFCLEILQSLGRYNRECTCGRMYQQDRGVKDSSKNQKQKRSFDYYLFYYNRYLNHMKSLELENQLYDKLELKMSDLMKNYHMNWIDLQYLKVAAQVLCMCRQTLAYTYAFASYLVQDNQFRIFEDNQENLQAAVENLSGRLETEITNENVKNMKQEIQNLYCYCQSRRKVLLEHIDEGYKENLWKYNFSS